MDMNMVSASFLAAAAAGGVAYVFLYPLLSGDARAEKRQKALMHSSLERRIDRMAAGVNRREHVAQSLKELDAREKARNKLTVENRIAHAGLRLTKNRFLLFSAILGVLLGCTVFVITTNAFVSAAALFAGVFGLPRWILNYLKKR